MTESQDTSLCPAQYEPPSTCHAARAAAHAAFEAAAGFWLQLNASKYALPPIYGISTSTHEWTHASALPPALWSVVPPLWTYYAAPSTAAISTAALRSYDRILIPSCAACHGTHTSSTPLHAHATKNCDSATADHDSARLAPFDVAHAARNAGTPTSYASPSPRIPCCFSVATMGAQG